MPTAYKGAFSGSELDDRLKKVKELETKLQNETEKVTKNETAISKLPKLKKLSVSGTTSETGEIHGFDLYSPDAIVASVVNKGETDTLIIPHIFRNGDGENGKDEWGLLCLDTNTDGGLSAKQTINVDIYYFDLRECGEIETTSKDLVTPEEPETGTDTDGSNGDNSDGADETGGEEDSEASPTEPEGPEGPEGPGENQDQEGDSTPETDEDSDDQVESPAEPEVSENQGDQAESEKKSESEPEPEEPFADDSTDDTGSQESQEVTDVADGSEVQEVSKDSNDMVIPAFDPEAGPFSTT